MDLWFHLRRGMRRMLPGLLWACFMAYFGYHLLHGDRGLIAHARLSEEVVRTRIELDRVRTQREALEARVGLLHPDHINRDMLDERARLVLGLAHPDEIIIPLRER